MGEEAGMRIAVIGAGGIGGYFGGRLAQAGADVHLVARGANLAALRAHGLRVRSIGGDFAPPVSVTDDPATIGPCDHVLLCVKAFDTEAVAPSLRPLLHDNTAVVSLQNGVDNEDRLARVLGAGHVMGGAAYIFAELVEPGVVAHTGFEPRIAFGELDGSASERATRLLEACDKAGFAAELSPNIRGVLWAKFAFICAMGLTAAVRLPIGEIRATAASWAAFQRMVDEVCTVAETEGVTLPPNLRQQIAAAAQGLDPGGYSSLHNDLVAGRRMELEALHGAVVRHAAEHGVPVPATAAVHAVLAPWAARNERARG
jgi:2-dehydropantoate 2-reductase